jgi:hypothetical protein
LREAFYVLSAVRAKHAAWKFDHPQTEVQTTPPIARTREIRFGR